MRFDFCLRQTPSSVNVVHICDHVSMTGFTSIALVSAADVASTDLCDHSLLEQLTGADKDEDLPKGR